MPSPTERRSRRSGEAVVLTAGAGALLVAAAVVVGVAYGDWRAANAQLTPVLTQLEGLESIAAEHRDLTSEVEALYKGMGDPDKLAGERAAANQLTEAVSRVANKAGINVKSVQAVTGMRSGHKGYVMGGVRASFNCQLKNLIKFLQGIEKDGAITGVQEVSITGDPKKPGHLSVTLVAVALACEEK